MKKLCVLLVAFLLIVSTAFVGCGNASDNVIRINEVTHSIFYAPMYAAINLGYLEDEGFDVELVNGGGADNSMTALLSNSADIGLMGPEAAIYVVQGDSNNAPVVFGQLTKRDGSFLVSRTNETNFDWASLAGKEVIAGRKGGVPAMTLQYVIETAGGLIIGDGTSSTVNFNTDVAFNLMTAAFEGGQGDYVTMFEPTASEYERAGKGYVVASVGEASGEVPYTAFMALESYMSKNSDKVVAFLKAVNKAYNYLLTATDDQIYDALSASFASTSKDSIVASVKRYVQIDAWVSTPVMSESALDRLQDIMINAGELETKVAFADVVDNSYAEQAMAE